MVYGFCGAGADVGRGVPTMLLPCVTASFTAASGVLGVRVAPKSVSVTW